MNIKQLEKEILKALEINSKYDWDNNLETSPNQEFKDLKRFVKECFKEHNNN